MKISAATTNILALASEKPGTRATAKTLTDPETWKTPASAVRYGSRIHSPFSGGFPGGKEGSGVPQTIINYIPAHRRYFELFLGGGTIARWKRPAERSILCDIDPEVISAWEKIETPDSFEITVDDWFRVYYHIGEFQPDWFFYLDPPYPVSVRSSKKNLYRAEMKSRKKHEFFLQCWSDVESHVMIFSYRNPLYDEILKGWNVVEFDSMTRGGIRREAIYMNYNIEDYPLHDYRYLGEGRRERERIREKVKGYKKRIKRLPRREREAILRYIQSNFFQL